LVASSDVERRATLAKILEECNLEAVLASSVEEVRIALTKGSVHLLFCEDNLPEGDFREVLRVAKAIRPEAQVVVASLLGGWGMYLEAMQLGAFDFIAPPYRDAAVRSIVNGVYLGYCLKNKETRYHCHEEDFSQDEAAA
jgi:DNA-binding NtrC family response regulator